MLNFNALIKKFQKKIFFTIHTGNQGFTDQMMQFSAFYKLGLALNYNYTYTPFVSTRSQPLKIETKHPNQSSLETPSRQIDIYDFLGFNQHFNTSKFHIENESIEDMEIELSDDILNNNKIHSLEALKSYIQTYVIKNKKTQNKLKVIFRLDRKKPTKGKSKREFFSLIHTDIPAFQDGLNFNKMYFESRKSSPINSQFADGKLKVVVHIRQGDTGFIETPWNTCIPVGTRRPDRLKEQVDFEKMKSSYSNNFVDSLFEPMEYYNFLEKLLSHFNSQLFTTLVFSDGYQRAFNIIRQNIDKLNLNPKQKKSLRDSEHSYDETQFKIFSGIKNSESIIGETQENLHTLIHSTLTADIVIVAAQQRMLPKLAANFCENKRPFIIVLYRKKVPDYSDVIQNDADRYIYTDIDNPDFDKIVRRIEQLVKKAT